MYDIFDANELLFKALNKASIKAIINGEVLNDGRPINSLKEDIVVNTITISQTTKPQIATSNINCYALDAEEGKKNTNRLKVISRKVIEEFKNTEFIGKSVFILSQNIIQETNNKEHYVNIRIQWMIYDTKTIN